MEMEVKLEVDDSVEVKRGLKRTSLENEGEAGVTSSSKIESETEEEQGKRVCQLESRPIDSPTVGDEAGSASPMIPEKLEVPSENIRRMQREIMIENFMKTETSSQEGSQDDTAPKGRGNNKKKGVPNPKPLPQPRRTFKMSSSVLDKVKAFLPEMKISTDALCSLPDPSKISLESDSDMDTTDCKPGPSGSSSSSHTTTEETYVEMNLALVEHSDSDSTSDDEDNPILQGRVIGLPDLKKRSVIIADDQPATREPETKPETTSK